MRTFLKAIFCLAVIGIVGIVGYAAFSDLPAPRQPVELPVNAQ